MTDETIFAAAIEKPTPADRAAYLDHACAADPGRRRRLEGLLAAHDRAAEFMERPAFDPESAATRTFGGTYRADADVLALLDPSRRPDSLGRLRHYEVLEVLGRGGFGTVFKAFDEKLHRVVAIKVLAPQLASSGTACQRFIREARAAAAVRHENVVDVHSVDEDGPAPFLVMEYVDGKTLQDVLDTTGSLSVEQVLRIGVQAATGLAVAHRQGLVHRDVKPANILLENGIERVKLTDFGLARAVDDAALTQSGVIAGTPLYMSPEQAQGNPVDHRSDLFSLGSVLYAMCTGRPPFRAETTAAVLRRVADDTPRPIREVNSRIPAWLAKVVEKLHAKNPADRFQSAGEVAERLTKYLTDLQVKGGVTAADREGPPSGQRVRRSATLAVCAVSAIGVVAYALTRPVPPSDRSPDTAGQTVPPVSLSGLPPLPAGVPFDEDRAKAHQQEWAAHLSLPVEFPNTLGMKFRVIPSGRFQMGSSNDQIAQEERESTGNGQAGYMALVRAEAPRHPVTLTRPFAIGATEVTVGQFRQFAEALEYVTPGERDPKSVFGDVMRKRAKGFDWRDTGGEQLDDHPVYNLAWEDADAFCRWLSEKESRHYRLPTEAEWEWACRAGTDGRYPWGRWTQERAERFANLSPPNTKQSRLQSVGLRAANPFGLFDTCGNAPEWCRDYYGPYSSDAATDPTGPAAGNGRVSRGGSVFNGLTRKPGSAYRVNGREVKVAGFRVVLDVLAPPRTDTAVTIPAAAGDPPSEQK